MSKDERVFILNRIKKQMQEKGYTWDDTKAQVILTIYELQQIVGEENNMSECKKDTIAPKPAPEIEFIEAEPGEVVDPKVIAWNLRMQAKLIEKNGLPNKPSPQELPEIKAGEGLLKGELAPPQLQHKLPTFEEMRGTLNWQHKLHNAISELQEIVLKLMQEKK